MILWIGIIAAVLGVISYIPQVLQVITSKKTRDLSLGTYAFLCFVNVLWLTYALLEMNIPLIINSSIVLVFVAIIFLYKLKYK